MYNIYNNTIKIFTFKNLLIFSVIFFITSTSLVYFITELNYLSAHHTNGFWKFAPDAQKYHNSAISIKELILNNILSINEFFFIDRNHANTKWLALIYILVDSNKPIFFQPINFIIWILSIFLIYKTTFNLSNSKIASCFACLFFFLPSTLFNFLTLMRDAIFIFGISFFFYIISTINYNKINILYYSLLLFPLFLIDEIRSYMNIFFYLLIILIPFYLLFLKKINFIKFLINILIVLSIVTISFSLSLYLNYNSDKKFIYNHYQYECILKNLKYNNQKIFNNFKFNTKIREYYTDLCKNGLYQISKVKIKNIESEIVKNEKIKKKGTIRKDRNILNLDNYQNNNIIKKVEVGRDGVKKIKIEFKNVENLLVTDFQDITKKKDAETINSSLILEELNKVIAENIDTNIIDSSEILKEVNKVIEESISNESQDAEDILAKLNEVIEKKLDTKLQDVNKISNILNNVIEKNTVFKKKYSTEKIKNSLFSKKFILKEWLSYNQGLNLDHNIDIFEDTKENKIVELKTVETDITFAISPVAVQRNNNENLMHNQLKSTAGTIQSGKILKKINETRRGFNLPGNQWYTYGSYLEILMDTPFLAYKAFLSPSIIDFYYIQNKNFFNFQITIDTIFNSAVFIMSLLFLYNYKNYNLLHLMIIFSFGMMMFLSLFIPIQFTLLRLKTAFLIPFYIASAQYLFSKKIFNK